MWSAPKHFIVQTSPEGLYRFEGPGFNTVQELIMHQFHSGTVSYWDYLIQFVKIRSSLYNAKS